MTETSDSDNSTTSLYERMLSDPNMRDAYFNTPIAQLWADPEEPLTQDVRDALDSNQIVYVFQPDKYLARPILQIEAGQFVGEEVIRAIGYFLICKDEPITT